MLSSSVIVAHLSTMDSSRAIESLLVPHLCPSLAVVSSGTIVVHLPVMVTSGDMFFHILVFSSCAIDDIVANHLVVDTSQAISLHFHAIDFSGAIDVNFL